jgi:beta-xylosidase
MESLIRNPARASQVLDFTGILPKPYAPTDIDGLVEWKNKAYVIIECKHGDKDMSLGQKIAIERMTKDFNKAGKRAVAIVVEHDVDNIQQSVIVGDQIVRQVYYDNQREWREPNYIVTAKEAINNFIKYVEGNNGNV